MILMDWWDGGATVEGFLNRENFVEWWGNSGVT